MTSTPTPKLGVFSLAALLVSAHYGLGFLLGTAEQTANSGIIGTLYPVSISMGTLLLLLALARFYWNRHEQIWTLLGNQYGDGVRFGVGLLSWASLIGIGAVQIIGGAATLSVIGLPTVPVMVALGVAFVILSQLPLERASWLLRGLLLLNILILIYGLVVLQGLPAYGRSPLDFVYSLQDSPPGYSLGLVLSTFLLVQVDMKYQQYLVQAKDLKTLYLGCGLAGVVLLLLAFVPSNLVLAAQQAQILPPGLESKAVIPQILLWLGGSNPTLGSLLLLSLVIPALGLGSSILRVQTKTVFDLGLVDPNPMTRLLVPLLNGALALAIALRGGSIIGLIASFYAAYVSAVWVPFGGYLFQELGYGSVSKLGVKVALGFGSGAGFSTLGLLLWYPQAVLWHSPELMILALGLGFGLLGLGVGTGVERLRSAPVPLSK
ncbi:SLC5/6 family protein [Prochlorothrix hollandica]|uniref:Uncharacterized protein n=1 Tax=Prochlorothrix hollandica PCC 9006 = CALU 1027 TaxID=317619 RepID=A0A0M2PW07_PROHO|nr:hypothetical protein [Prochlorothrix hollandica]KKI98556.1 hypothetical protein PROH_16765 [Prochlorothrix hollandica PCC 9006 = CALU 1027]